MKKNININLFGTIYNIDEDAYELLQEYLNNLHAYFSKQEGGEEIADDIEHRIAELFWERKQLGVEAIDVMTVKTILNKLGKPEEMTDENAASEATSNNTSDSKNKKEGNPSSNNNLKEETPSGPRKLYRDTTDKQLGGVLSGLCHYFGGSDPLPWRIMFTILVLTLMLGNFRIFGFGISWMLLAFIYLVLWMIIPEAVSSEDRLKMKGKKVTPNSIKEEVLAEQEKREHKPQESGMRSTANGCLSFIITMFKIVGVLVLFAISIPLIIAFIAIVIAFVAIGSTGSMIAPFVATGEVSEWWVFALIVCGLVAIILPIYGLCKLLFSKTTHNSKNALMLLAIWICAVAALFPITKKTGILWNDNVNIFWQANNNNQHKSIHSTHGDDTIERNDMVDPFKAIVFDGVGRMTVEQADTFSFQAYGLAEILDQTTVSVHDSVLYIKTYKSDDYNDMTSPDYYLRLPELNSIKLSGVGSVQLQDSFIQTSSMDLVLEGVGALNADLIHCPSLTIKQHGIGKSVINVETEQLNATNSGIGKIELYGSTKQYNSQKSIIGLIEDNELEIK